MMVSTGEKYFRRNHGNVHCSSQNRGFETGIPVRTGRLQGKEVSYLPKMSMGRVFVGKLEQQL